jgi:hypothetical protein
MVKSGCSISLFFLLFVFLGPSFSVNAAEKSVIINEIMYHPPNDLEGLEYIELHNPGDESVELSSWSFTKGIRFTFPDGATIPPNGYIVVCRNLSVFRETFGIDINALGNFEGQLANDGEQIELSDVQGKRVDSVEYDDRLPWPVSADGYSASLERMASPLSEGGSQGVGSPLFGGKPPPLTPPQEGENLYPSAPSREDTFNWASSPLPLGKRRPTGTPGQQNTNHSANLPPIISAVKYEPHTPTADQSVTVEAKIEDADGVDEVVLLYRIARSGFEGAEDGLPMKQVDGDEKSGRYSAVIAPQPSGNIVRFRIRATDAIGTTRFQPHPNDLRPTYSYFTDANQALKRRGTTIPLGLIIHVEPGTYQAAQRALSRRKPDTEVSRWLDEELLRAGMNLEAAWSFLLTTQHLTAAQIRELRAIYRQRFETREKEIERVIQSGEMTHSRAVIQAFNDAGLNLLSGVLTAEQHERFIRWHKAYLFSMMIGGFKWEAEQYLKRSVDLKGVSFFSH